MSSTSGDEKRDEVKLKENKQSLHHAKSVSKPDSSVISIIKNSEHKSTGPVITKHDRSPSSTYKQYLQAGPELDATVNTSNVTINRSICMTPPMKTLKCSQRQTTLFEDDDEINEPNNVNMVLNEIFLPSKDHVFLTETLDSSRLRNMNNDIGVDVSTSVVRSPARVVRHHPHHFSKSESLKHGQLVLTNDDDSVFSTDKYQQGEFVFPDGLDTVEEQNCETNESLKQSQANNQSKPTSHVDLNKHKTIDAKDEQHKKQGMKKKGQIVASRYMQPHKGPMKATDKVVASTSQANRNVATNNLLRSTSQKNSNTSQQQYFTSTGTNNSNKSFQNSINRTNMSPSTRQDHQQQQQHHKRSKSTKDDKRQPLPQQQLDKKSFFFAPTLNISTEKPSTPAQDEDVVSNKQQHINNKTVATAMIAMDSRSNNHKRGVTSSTPNLLHSTLQLKGQDLSSYMSSIGGMDVSSIVPLDPSKQLGMTEHTRDISISQISADNNSNHNTSKQLKKSRKSTCSNVSSSSSSATSKPPLKCDPMLTWTRYLQYVFINAKIEQAMKEQYKHAREELYELWLLAEESERKKHDLQLELDDLERKVTLNQTLSVLEEILLPINVQIDQATSMHDKLVTSLDRTRHNMEVSADIYIPEEHEAPIYYGELTAELEKTEELLNDITLKIQDQPPHLDDMMTHMQDVKDLVPQITEGSNECKTTVIETVNLILDECFLQLAAKC